ncbi:MAG: beta-lactamase family protein [Oscillospiraceae bacterium]|nr:beta-lactamase family protein [Oscillospiraceae bacterium]
MAVLTSNALERAAFPEELGVSSARLRAYIDDVLANGLELHSVMVLRHGKVAAEVWREPYAPEHPHTMYSVSKTITAIAVGFAVEEGFFNVDDKVIDFFPEQRPKRTDPHLENLKVFNLLTMTSGKDINVFEHKAQHDWIDQFFRSGWGFAPGTSWKYINENQHILLELVRRTTGQTATAFLTSRLYEPLGFGRVPFWETSLTGTEAGGWGLFLKTEELAKIAQCLLDDGKWKGRQLIPAEWTHKMQSKLVDNTPTNEGKADQCMGYGYCMWQNPIPNSSRMDGMFGQYAVILRDYNAVLITTTNEIDEPKARSFIWKHFPGVFCKETAVKPGKSVRLFMPPLSPPISKPRCTEMEQCLAGRVYKIRRAILNNVLVGLPLSVLTLPLTQMSAFERGNITNVRFDFAEDTCTFRWTEDGSDENVAICGMDGIARTGPVKIANVPYTMNCWAVWSAENTLEVHLRPLESHNDRILSFRFRCNGVRMTPGMTPGLPSLLHNMLEIYMLPYLPLPALSKPGMRVILPLLAAVSEPSLNGRCIVKPT